MTHLTHLALRSDALPVNATKMLLPGAATALFLSAGASAEVCRFTGTTNHNGYVSVTTAVDAVDGATRIDVALALDATTFWSHIHYLVHEISSWRGREIQSVAVNTRYLVGDHIVRQQWDAFQRTTDGLQARRVQAKTLDDFRRSHPGFVQHWDPMAFGSPWLQDYQDASPERRADLDLTASPLPAGLSSPLAMAFYWTRWLPPGSQDAQIFLPGFKADKVVDVPIAAAASTAGLRRQASLQYPALSKASASTVTTMTSADGHLRELAFDVHGSAGSASGQLHEQGCVGTPVKPR